MMTTIAMISKKKRKSKEDEDALKTLKKLRNKTTTPFVKRKIIHDLTKTPKKMEKIINTWATIRATKPSLITPQDNRTFYYLKTQYIKHHYPISTKITKK